jgi:hypothetical protein
MSEQVPDPGQPADTLTAAGAVSLRLLAGTVSKKTMQSLKRTVAESPAKYPWRSVTEAILAEPVDERELVQQGLRAQREWILRGGREVPGRPASARAKSIVARLLAQSIFLFVATLTVLAVLLALKNRWPDVDIYRILTWMQEAKPAPRGG